MEKNVLHYYVTEDICVACGLPTIPGDQICANCQRLLQTPMPPQQEKREAKPFPLLQWFGKRKH